MTPEQAAARPRLVLDARHRVKETVSFLICLPYRYWPLASAFVRRVWRGFQSA